MQAQLQLLENKKQKIIDQEFWNIVKLKKDEKKSNESILNDFLFDVSFERFEISSNFD